MRALYVGASHVKRYEHRHFAIDVVTYDDEQWIAYVFGPGVDGKRLAPFSSWQGAIAVAKLHVDHYVNSLAATTENEQPPAKPRNAKRSRKRKKKEAAA